MSESRQHTPVRTRDTGPVPDAHPSLVSPETAYAAVAGRDARWDGRLIAGGAMDDGGLPALASRLAVSPRHLTRLVVAEVGATPGQLVRTRRAHTARLLLAQTGRRSPSGRCVDARGLRPTALGLEHAPPADITDPDGAHMSATPSPPLLLLEVSTPGGAAHAVVDPRDGALRLFAWHDPADSLARLPLGLRERGFESAAASTAEVADVAGAIARYGDGDPTAHEALAALAVEQTGGPFFGETWRALRTVPAGSRVTYTELAALAGRPSAVRAAASACARNLVALVVPCHRVLRRDGSLGGFAYGLEVKRALLAHEARHWAGREG